MSTRVNNRRQTLPARQTQNEFGYAPPNFKIRQNTRDFQSGAAAKPESFAIKNVFSSQAQNFPPTILRRPVTKFE
jgi:hypothetical protein